LNRDLIRNLVLYGLIGSFAAGVDTLLFHLLVYRLGWVDLVANVLTVAVGITISFFLNRRFNFKVMDRTGRRYAAFFSVGLIGLGLSELILLVGRLLEAEPLAVKIVSVFIVAIVQFTLNKTVSFRRAAPR
jgi:putative flippase GtrA